MRRPTSLAHACLFACLLATPVAGAETAAPETVPTAAESDYLTRVRQLTYEGRRAGEGYFSPDGTKLVFQSEREEGNPFFQIYVLDLESGDTRRVSPGQGKTTCAFFRPGSGDVLFASTHHDPKSADQQAQELEDRAAGRERRYAWDYDPEMELYVELAATGELVRLTDARGYDAEASYSPDGEWIVFTSNRPAYEGELSDEEKAQLEIDPSYFAEIYRMRADGSEVERLTEAPGYDGGPFFFPDGSRIVWRRFDEEGLIADVWTMNPDGSDQRPITDFESMSWAPYVHPSGEYVFFASNKHGFENFEIFIVDAAGTKQPVRVTYTDGFDGLPVPSPDGRRLVWTSTRRDVGKGQLFVGEWNHEAALAALAAAPSADPIRADVEFLASPDLEGRLTGSPGEKKAAEYIERRLGEIGAEPLPGRDGYRVPFDFTAGVEDAGSFLALSAGDGEASRFDGDAVQALSFSDSGEVTAPVVFAGYGLVVPQGQGVAYDSYAGVDVDGKIALVLRYFPEDADQETRAVLARYAGLRYKALHARQNGAVGMIVLTGPRSPNAGETVAMSFDTAISGSGLVAASVSGEVGAKLFAAAGKEAGAVQESFDDANPHVTGFDLEGVEATLHVDVVRERREGANLVAVLPANGNGDGDGDGEAVVDEPWIVLGAHYDHLGRGNHGNSLAGKEQAGDVHHGADDNASGTAALLAAGERLAAMERRRHVVLAFWSGEELGLLGSSDFVDDGLLAADQVAAYLNFDMVGRLRDNALTLQAVGSSPAWRPLIERANVPAGFDLTLQDDPYLPTDSASFNRVEVPTLAFFTGSHEDYHRPSDTADKIDYEGIGRIARFAATIAGRLADSAEPPEFVAVERSRDGGDRDTLRAYTGTIPDYTTEVEGLRLSGVIGGGPADEAGLEEGDVIVEFGGQTIANIYDYTYALDAVKIDQPVKVVVLRDGERVELEMTPRARE